MESTILITCTFNIYPHEIDNIDAAIATKIQQSVEGRCADNSFVVSVIREIKRGPIKAFPYSTSGLMTVDLVLEARVIQYAKGDIIPAIPVYMNSDNIVLAKANNMSIVLDTTKKIMDGVVSGDVFPVKIKSVNYAKYGKMISLTGKRYVRPSHNTYYMPSEIDALTQDMLDEIEYYRSEITRYNIALAKYPEATAYFEKILFRQNNTKFASAIPVISLVKSYNTFTSNSILCKFAQLVGLSTDVVHYTVDGTEFANDQAKKKIQQFLSVKKTLPLSAIIIKLLRYQTAILQMFHALVLAYPDAKTIKQNARAWDIISRD